MSQIQLHADAALNAMADAGLKPADIDGIATAGETPVTVEHYLGLTPKWVDGTAVGGCSFMIHVRHAAAAIASGLCQTVLITHGESGRSGVGRTRNVVAPTSLAGQFEQPYGPMGPPTLFTIPVLRYMKTYGLSHEQLAMVWVAQREWAAHNPRATFKTPITVKDALNSRMIAYSIPATALLLVTDGGGALILVAAERARDFPQKPVYLLGTGESVETPMVSQMEDFTSSRAFRVAGSEAFAEAGITHKDVDHLMIYDAPCSQPGASFAHLPIYGLEDLGFVPRGEAGAFIAERNTAPGGRLPLNTNGGGLSYMHVRHVRFAGERPPDARVSPRPDPRRPDLGLPRRRRHVRRLRHDHQGERGAVMNSAALHFAEVVCAQFSKLVTRTAPSTVGADQPCGNQPHWS